MIRFCPIWLAAAWAWTAAAGRCASWLYKQKDILPAPDGFSPADAPVASSGHPREAAISETCAVLGYGRNQHGPLPYFNDEEGPYVAMSPELARFFADHLKPQAESFARATGTSTCRSRRSATGTISTNWSPRYRPTARPSGSHSSR